MQLKHKQQPCFAALVQPSSPRPAQNKRLTYRRPAAEPAPGGAKKSTGASTPRFDRQSEPWPRRFDKIVYFLSLFVVPKGLRWRRSAAWGRARAPPLPRQVPPPSEALPRQAFKSELHAFSMGERRVAGRGARTLRMWLQRPAWLNPRSPPPTPGLQQAFQASNPTLFDPYFHFHLTLKSFHHSPPTHQSVSENPPAAA